MAGPRDTRLVIDPAVPAHLARQLTGMPKWFEKYAKVNLPNEELVPGEDGLPSDSSPELDEVKEVEQVHVFEVSEIDEEHLSVRCEVRLIISVSLNDAEETVATVKPTWKMLLLAKPGIKSIIEHDHGWDCGWLPEGRR